MNLQEAMQALEAAGSEQTRKTYARHGVPAGKMFGVSYSTLGTLKKKIKHDQTLAKALWATGNYDARILATMVADPKAADDAILDAWAADLDCQSLAKEFATHYVSKTSLAKAKFEAWKDSSNEWLSTAAWTVLANLAVEDTGLPDIYFEGCLTQISKEIHSRPNRTREAMNNALIAIGVRNATLQDKANNADALIGDVTIDHGQTNCSTPRASLYIKKTLAKRAEQAAKKAAKA
jgi:3-methyladenine DNA glycosylase AlkD